MSLKLGPYVRMAGLVALAAAFVAGSSGRADTLLIQGEITGISQFNGESNLSVLLPTLNNVVLADYSSIDLQLSVVPGREVVVDENSLFSFGVDFFRAGTVGSSPAGGTCSFSMTGSGPAPSGAGTFCGIGTNAELLYYNNSGQKFSAGDTFTQLNYVMNVPANLPVLSGANFTPSGFESPNFSFYTSKGGTVATIQSAATPEPGTFVLLGTALLSGAGLIRRRLQA